MPPASRADSLQQTNSPVCPYFHSNNHSPLNTMTKISLPLALPKECHTMPHIFLALLFVLFSFFASVQQSLAEAGAETDFSYASSQDGKIVVCMTVTIPKGYHAYAHDAGDAGRPTDLFFSVDTLSPGEVYYPSGTQQPDSFDKTLQVNVYEDTQHIYTVLPKEAAGKKWKATISMLLCSNFNCLPWDQTREGTIPEKLPALETVPWQNDWLALSATGSSVTPSEPPLTFSMAGEAQPQAQALSPASKENEQELLPPPGYDFTLTPRYDDENLEISNLGGALIFGLVAGFILNVMPCVLPVLSMKLQSLLIRARGGKQGLSDVRQHSFFFAAGNMTFFTVLAIVLGLLDMMWGQFFQSQLFLLIMLMLVFLMGLTTMGVFTLPLIPVGSMARTSAHPRLDAYVTGFVTTFLATPCSGPLLGGVLGWAFTQPMPILVAVFWSVGLGMSLPHLVLVIWPRLASMLKPSEWMHAAERFLGVAMLGCAIYLLSILPEFKHIPALIALLASGVAAYTWEKTCTLEASKRQRTISTVFFIFILAGSLFYAHNTEKTEGQWTSFTIEHFREQLGKRPMILTFTADWCPNCKFVEATVLTESRIGKISDKYNAEFILVDLTNPNAHGTKLLDMLGSRSIPVTAIFPAGDKATSPTVLRDVFTSASFEKAVEETLP